MAVFFCSFGRWERYPDTGDKELVYLVLVSYATLANAALCAVFPALLHAHGAVSLRHARRRRDRRHLREARARSTGSYDSSSDLDERPLHPPPTNLGDPPQRQGSTTLAPALALETRRRQRRRRRHHLDWRRRRRPFQGRCPSSPHYLRRRRHPRSRRRQRGQLRPDPSVRRPQRMARHLLPIFGLALDVLCL